MNRKLSLALAVAAAWSCYGGRPAKVETVQKLVYGPEPEGLSPVKAADRAHRRERAMKLYADLFAAGHHTTLQHANFVFVLDNVSRLAIWSFFHAHPFYNSEQVSQRYVEVKEGTYAVPALEGEALTVYRATFTRDEGEVESITVGIRTEPAKRRIMEVRSAFSSRPANAVQRSTAWAPSSTCSRAILRAPS